MEKLRIKVIIEEGIVSSVLADGPVEVEIIDIDPDYEDYDALEKYALDVRSDSTLKAQDFTVAHFEEEITDHA